MKYTARLSVVLGLLALASASCRREQPHDLPEKVSPDEAVPAGTIHFQPNPALAENQVDVSKRVEKQMAEDEALRKPPPRTTNVPAVPETPPAKPDVTPGTDVAPPPAETPEIPPAAAEVPAEEPQVLPEEPQTPPAEQAPPAAPEEPAPEEGGFGIPAG